MLHIILIILVVLLACSGLGSRIDDGFSDGVLGTVAGLAVGVVLLAMLFH